MTRVSDKPVVVPPVGTTDDYTPAEPVCEVPPAAPTDTIVRTTPQRTPAPIPQPPPPRAASGVGLGQRATPRDAWAELKARIPADKMTPVAAEMLRRVSANELRWALSGNEFGPNPTVIAWVEELIKLKESGDIVDPRRADLEAQYGDLRQLAQTTPDRALIRELVDLEPIAVAQNPNAPQDVLRDLVNRAVGLRQGGSAWDGRPPLAVNVNKPLLLALARNLALPSEHHRALEQIHRNTGDQVFLDINAGPGMSPAQVLGLTADIAGIFDPTPISDGVSGVLSLGSGDWRGAALSGVAMIPYLGDGLAKPAKIAARVASAFPGLARLVHASGGVGRLLRTLEKLGSGIKSPAIVGKVLKSLSNLQEAAVNAYRNQAWLQKAKKLELPTDGPVPFVPPTRWNPSNPLRTADGKGYVDAFGNEWRKGPSRTPGEPFEWDVVPASRDSGLAALSRDGSHVNVSLAGDVSHR